MDKTCLLDRTEARETRHDCFTRQVTRPAAPAAGDEVVDVPEPGAEDSDNEDDGEVPALCDSSEDEDGEEKADEDAVPWPDAALHTLRSVLAQSHVSPRRVPEEWTATGTHPLPNAHPP